MRLAISARTLVLTTLGSIAVMVLGVSAAVPAASTALHIVPTTPNQIAAAVRAPGAKATLVNVWATFCGPCRKEFPELVRLQRTWKPKGLRVMFVSADTDDQKAAVTSFLRHQGVSGTTWIKSGDDMQFINGLSPKWSGAIPFTLVYDAKGKLVRSWEGMADYDTFEAAVRQAIAGS